MATHQVFVSLDPLMARMLQRQSEFQDMLGRHPDNMTREQLKEYIRTQAFALTAEVHETVDECQWKPWAVDIPDQPVVHKERYIGELADVYIFFMNMMLAGKVTTAELCRAVDAKQDKNIKRQQTGYNAKDTKCPGCKRAYDDASVMCTPEGTIGPNGPAIVPPNGPEPAWCDTRRAYVEQDGSVIE